MTVRHRISAVTTGVLLCGFASATAIAAPGQADRAPITVADAAQAQPASVTDDEDSATCSKPRKRLWVEGEGWIVRRVTICR